jgi:cytochrome c553
MMRQLPIRKLITIFLLLLLSGGFLAAQQAYARRAAAPAQQASPIHPNFPLLDEEGNSVLESGAPVSTMQTCGACHDTEFIATTVSLRPGISDFDSWRNSRWS